MKDAGCNSTRTAHIIKKRTCKKTESFNTFYHTPVYKNEQNVREILQWRLLCTVLETDFYQPALFLMLQMFPLQHMGLGMGGPSNAIAVAASQAIAATQQLTGRRTSRSVQLTCMLTLKFGGSGARDKVFKVL